MGHAFDMVLRASLLFEQDCYLDRTTPGMFYLNHILPICSHPLLRILQLFAPAETLHEKKYLYLIPCNHCAVECSIAVVSPGDPLDTG